MDQAIWKILAFILAALLMFITPMMSIYDRQDDITYTMVYGQVQELVDVSRNRGFIDEFQVNKLYVLLNATGNTYDVTFEHYKKVYVPIYDNAGVFLDDYYVSYEGYFNGDILPVLSTLGRYDLGVGDLFFVRVENVSRTKAQMAKEMLLNMSSDYPAIILRSGGMVHHEPH